MIEVALGIDVGTGSTKAGLVDAEGRLLTMARCRHDIDVPQAGWTETDPYRWLESARAAVADSLGQQPSARVVSIGLSGQMHGVVLCDADGQPTRPAVLWPDRRADRRLQELAPRLNQHLGALANPLVPGMAGPILAAVAAEEPAAITAARWALQPKDWVRLHLTREAASDPSDASATLLWDLHEDRWSAQLAEIFGLPAALLPPVAPSASLAGTLQHDAATELGLASNTPVAVGAADTAAALLGASVGLNETQVSTGTGGQIATLLGRAHADPTRRTHLYRAASPGRWYAMAAIQNAGLAIDWALDVLRADHAEAAQAVAATVPGADGVTFLPYLTGERTPHLNAHLTANWAGLHPAATRASLLRAVYEGVAFALRDGLDALRAAGHTIDHALLAGGGSTAAWWQQLLADALDIPLIRHETTDASVRGAALLGWSAAGVEISPHEHARRKSAVSPRGARFVAPLQRFRKLASEQDTS